MIGRFGQRMASELVYDALVQRSDIDRNGQIDFNEWLLFDARKGGGATGASAAEAAIERADQAAERAASWGVAKGNIIARPGRPLSPSAATAAALSGRVLQLQLEGAEGDDDDDTDDIGDGWAGATGAHSHALTLPPPPSGTTNGGAVNSGATATAPQFRAAAARGWRDDEAAGDEAARPRVPLERLWQLVATCTSRDVVDELRGVRHVATGMAERDSQAAMQQLAAKAHESAELIEAAEAFMAMEGEDQTGVLSFEQFEAALMGHVMASGAADASLSSKRVKRMFARADLNHDGRIDFNEFLAMRRSTQRHAQKAAERTDLAERLAELGRRRQAGQLTDPEAGELLALEARLVVSEGAGGSGTSAPIPPTVEAVRAEEAAFAERIDVLSRKRDAGPLHRGEELELERAHARLDRLAEAAEQAWARMDRMAMLNDRQAAGRLTEAERAQLDSEGRHLRRLTEDYHRHAHEHAIKQLERKAGRDEADGIGASAPVGAAVEVPHWVQAVRDVQDKEAARRNELEQAEHLRLQARLQLNDSIADLDVDDLHALEKEILPYSGDGDALQPPSSAEQARRRQAPPQRQLQRLRLDAEACRSSLRLLGMRVGKMLSDGEVDEFIHDLLNREGDGSGTLTGQQLLQGIRDRAGLPA